MKTIIRSYEFLNKEQIAAALKRSVCRHKNHGIKITAGSTGHKIFCNNCGKLLKVSCQKDSTLKGGVHPTDYNLKSYDAI